MNIYFRHMDYDVELKFQEVKKQLEIIFGEGMDVQSLLFMVGVNELGMGYKNFSKAEKTNLIHIAICTVLEPYGYYQFEGLDEDKWPHFKLLKKIPYINSREQQHLIKEALTSYFLENNYVSLSSS